MLKTTVLMSLLLAAGAATAQEKVTVQLKWLPQAQFAGYYVAAAKGFYKDAGARAPQAACRSTRRRCWTVSKQS